MKLEADDFEELRKHQVFFVLDWTQAIPIRVEVFQEDSRGPPAVRLNTNRDIKCRSDPEDSRSPTTIWLGTIQGTEMLSPAVVTMEKHGTNTATAEAD